MLHEIATIADVGPSAVSNWRVRGVGFPAPVAIIGERMPPKRGQGSGRADKAVELFDYREDGTPMTTTIDTTYTVTYRYAGRDMTLEVEAYSPLGAKAQAEKLVAAPIIDVREKACT